MKNSYFFKNNLLSLIFISLGFILLFQTTTFSQFLLPVILDERGDTINVNFPPPDSTYIHNEIIIHFKAKALILDSLCYSVPAPIIGKEKNDKPLGIPKNLWVYLMTQQFPINNIIKNSNLKSRLVALGGTYLKRITPANPCTDTYSVTRYGDTIPCDDYLWMTLHLNNDTSAVTAVIQLLSNFQSEIIWADLNSLYQPFTDVTPNDNYFNLQISLDSTLSGFRHAWMRQVGDSSIIVGVIDDGVDYHNCDLGSSFGAGKKVAGGCNFTEPITQDFSYESGHGTPVAGIIGALTDSSSCSTTPTIGVAGIAGGWGLGQGVQSKGRGCTLYGFRTLDSLTWHQYGHREYPINYLIGAIRDAVNGKYGESVHIINLSLGKTKYNESLRSAINYANQNGVSVVVARGNGGILKDTVYPAYFDNEWVTSVGGSTYNRQKIFFSSFGLKMDFLAPSGGCATGDPKDSIVFSTAYTVNGAYPNADSCFDGTSAASPHAAGLIALLRSTAKDSSWIDLEPEDFEGMLKASAKDLKNIPGNPTYKPGYDAPSGWGHMQADSLYDMIDKGYKITHYSKINNLDSSDWSQNKNALYFFKFDTTKFDWLDTNIYQAKYRTISGIINLPSGHWIIDNEHKLYVWGRSGHGAKSGFNLSTLNYQSGYTRVLSGSGSSDTTLKIDGIIHSDSLNVKVVTYQYDIWDITGNIHLGHLPNDTLLGCNISVFGDINNLVSVPENYYDNSDLKAFIYPNPTNQNAKLQIILPNPTFITISIYNLLGNKINDLINEKMLNGIQTFNLNLYDLISGIYFIKINTNCETKFLKLIKIGE